MGLIIPEVFADAVNSALGVTLRASKLAKDYTNLDDITQYGDTYHFPTFDRIGNATIITKGTPLVPNNVSMTDNVAKIKHVGNAARIFDIDSIQVKGDMKNDMAAQLGETLARAVDADLVADILANATYKDATLTTLSASDVDAAFDVFGDSQDSDEFAGILINSRLRNSFLAMTGRFTNRNDTLSADRNGVARDHGLLGYWGEIPVYMSDNGTYDSSNNKAMLAIIKKGALGVIWQKMPSVEEQRDALNRATDIVADELYAAKLLNADGVSVLQIG